MIVEEDTPVKKQPLDGSEFNSVLLEAIDETLSVYGESTKSAFYEYLRKAFNLPKRKIPARIDEFSRALEELFGSGSKSLEILVMKNLHSIIGVVWEWKGSNPWVLPDLTFKDYVRFAKKYFEDFQKYENQLSFIISEKEALKMYR